MPKGAPVVAVSDYVRAVPALHFTGVPGQFAEAGDTEDLSVNLTIVRQQLRRCLGFAHQRARAEQANLAIGLPAPGIKGGGLPSLPTK